MAKDITNDLKAHPDDKVVVAIGGVVLPNDQMVLRYYKLPGTNIETEHFLLTAMQRLIADKINAIENSHMKQKAKSS